MAEIVDTHPRQLGRRQDVVELTAHVPLIERCADGSGEHWTGGSMNLSDVEDDLLILLFYYDQVIKILETPTTRASRVYGRSW